MKEKLLIIGANGHGKVILDIALKLNKYKEIAFLDDNENIKECMGKVVIGNTKKLEQYIDEYDMVVAIGNALIRKRILDNIFEAKGSVPVLIHPSAVIGMNVEIGKGTVIMAGAIVNPSVQIGTGCIVNTGATIDHDCIIGDYVHVSVGSHLAGTVTVGDNTWIGIGAVIINNVDIVSDVIVGAGSVVIGHIQDVGTYMGVPAKKKIEHIGKE